MKNMTITLVKPPAAGMADQPKRRGNRTTRVPQILEVAIKVFASGGGAGFTQTRVASDAGIRLATLQHYFGTRDELLRSTIEEMTNRYIGQYRALAKDKLRSPEERLDAIVDDVFEALTGPGSLGNAFALHCWSLAENETFARDLMAEVIGEFLEVFSGLVAKINPSLPASECTLRGTLILSHLQGLMIFTRRAGDNTPDLGALRAATKVVWKALSTASQ